MGGERQIFKREFGLSAGQLWQQLHQFQRHASVHVVIHDWAPHAFLALAANATKEPGKRYELRQRVVDLTRALAARPADMRVHVLAYRSSVAQAPRRLSPRSVIAKSGDGMIAEIHADHWRWAEHIHGDTLDIEIDLEAEFEPTNTNERIAEKPRSIWTPGEGWSSTIGGE